MHDRPVHFFQLSKFSLAGQGNGILEIGHAAALGAGLENPPVAFECLRELAVFLDMHAAGFFAINIDGFTR